MIKAKKIVIDENGLLSVQREHHTQPHMMVCPFRHGYHYCGEWCPHFPDVYPEENYETGELQCSLNLECGDFTAITAPEFIRMNGHEGHEEPKIYDREELKKIMVAARGNDPVGATPEKKTDHLNEFKNIKGDRLP